MEFGSLPLYRQARGSRFGREPDHVRPIGRNAAFAAALTFLLLSATLSFAQVTTAVTVRTPTPAAISEWQRDATVIRVFLTNTSDAEFRNVRIAFFIRDVESGRTVARTQNGDPAMPRFTIPARGALTLNGPQIIDQDAIDIDASIQADAVTTGQLPEGTYEYCVDVLDASGASISSTGEACAIFRIIVPDPPDLIHPVSESIADERYPAFRWTPVVLPGTSVRYRIVVKARLDGQTPRQAIESNGRSLTLLETEVSTTNYTWSPADRQFDDPTLRTSQFVWQVQAVDQHGAPAARNNGKSGIGEFWTGSGSSSSGAMTLEPYYPLPGDTVPWQPPHLIVRWGEFSDDFTRMDYTLVVRDGGGGEVGRNTRSLSWASGVLESQGVTTVDRARLIIVNYTNACALPTWMSSLDRGRRYTWEVEATFTRRDGSTSTLRSAPADFTLGLRTPENRGPEEGSSIAPGNDVALRWRAPSPRQADFQPTELMTRFRSVGCLSFSPAFEEMRLDVSRRRDFSTTTVTQRFPIPPTGNLVTGEDISALFAEQSHALGRLTDTGDYYWRVAYLRNDGTAYATGPVWRFRIGEGGSGGSTSGGDTISREECVRLTAASPERNGRWTAGRRPRFSVLAWPPVDMAAVRGGRLEIWQMSSQGEDTNAVIRRTPVFDRSFTGNAASSIRPRSEMGSGAALPLDLAFVNESGSAWTFEADSGATYLWRFTLDFDGARVRRDGVSCSRSSAATTLAKFTVGDDGSSACADECSGEAPTDRTPATRTFAPGDRVRVGRFEMTLTRATGTGASLSGEGEIPISFLNNARINVRFSGIRVNGAGQMYEGEVEAVHDASSPIPGTLANQLAGGTGLSEGQIQSIQTFVTQTERLVSGLAGRSAMSLPIGFDNVIEGERMVVAVVGMVFRPTNARFNASAHVTLPWTGPGTGLGVAARDICFHPNGIGGDGRVMLALAVDHGYREPGSWSFVFKAPTERDSGTAIMFDCRGFQWLRIQADIEFPRDWVVPARSGPDTGLVKASFATTIRRTGDFIVSATMDRFSPAGAPDFALEARDIVLDLSDADNPPGIAFPTRFSGDRTNRWRGLYIRRIGVTLPDELRTFDSTRPLQVEMNNAIFDFRGGFNFNIDLVNLLQYPEGNFGSWGASIDTLGVSFVNSSLENGHMSGRFQIPISDSAIDYRATLAQSHGGSGGLVFSFSVVPRDTINARLWVAQLSLNPTSRIDLVASADTFNISATLSGGVGISGEVGGIPGLNFNGITFQNVRVMSQQPYFEQGTWSFASPQHSTGGFPVSISDLGVVTGERDRGMGAGLRFTLSVNLQPGNSAISGGTTLSIWGVAITGDGPMRFDFDGIDLDSIGVAADLGAVRIAGGVRLYRRDPTFGTGFRGALDATFIQQINVKVTAQFGSVGTGADEYRYWYVDALARFEPGIMIFSGVGIYGFGGGVWHHMRREAMSPTQENAMMSRASTSATPGGDTTNPGGTNSGYRFVPDRGTGFGFRAMVTLGTFPKPDAFNADVAFEMEFLEDGGVGRISILGAGYFMAGLNNRSEAKVIATADLTYNFPAQTFDGLFDIRVNADPVTGGGRIVMHFSPRTWFVKAGEPPPDRRIRLSLADWLRIDTYLMVGRDLPFSLSLPPEITATLGEIPPMRSPAITQGDGFAFGASAAFNTGRLQFLIFYARFALTLGFDVGLLNNGDAATCEETGTPMGINGWYALGQFYAYFRGSIGIFVDLWFVSGEFEILDLQLAALLRGGAPNPTWLQGIVGGRYSILGGAITGSCRFEFEVGEECTPMRENPLAELDLITELKPTDGSTDVSWDVEPQASLNFEIDQPFEIVENRDDGSQRVRTFRVKVREFTIRPDGGATIPSSWRRATDRMQAVLTPGRALNGQTWYQASISAYGEERIGAAWQTARKLDGTPVNQTVTTRFRTGTPPDTIVPSNVALSYPRYRQRFFLQDECPDGYVSLHADQGYLFNSDRPGYTQSFHAKFIPLPAGGPPIEVPASYASSGRSGAINFEVPDMPNEQTYALQIIRRWQQTRRSSGAATAIDLGDASRTALATTTYGTIRERMTLQAYLREYSRGENTLTQQARRVTGFEMSRRTQPNEDLLYVYHFRTSRYDLLREKLKDLQLGNTRRTALGSWELLEVDQTGTELFDTWDVVGESYERSGSWYRVPPLVAYGANNRPDGWHTSYTNPWIYDIMALVDRIRMRSTSYLYSRSYFWRAAQRGALFAYQSGARGQLADNEISPPPPPPATGSSRTEGMMIMGTRSGMVWTGAPIVTITPKIEYEYSHGISIPFDWTVMRREVASILACCSGEFMHPDEERRLRQALARPYELMHGGTYRTTWYYTPCIGPDDTPVYLQGTFEYRR